MIESKPKKKVLKRKNPTLSLIGETAETISKMKPPDKFDRGTYFDAWWASLVIVHAKLRNFKLLQIVSDGTTDWINKHDAIIHVATIGRVNYL